MGAACLLTSTVFRALLASSRWLLVLLAYSLSGLQSGLALPPPHPLCRSSPFPLTPTTPTINAVAH